MKIKITDQVDRFMPGDEPDVPTYYAEALVKLGVAKYPGARQDPPENKMAEPPANKQAAGRGRGRGADRS